ncbi:MAG: exodeoxyribonuclease V subunit alpha [Desulfobulbaceae bacterium]|nr:exodeoxyribonuclease V subunit alpha [Desulfobulbaceae bacterium]
MMRPMLEQALTQGHLRQIDLHAGLFLHDLARRNREELLLAAVLASRAVGEGHICLPLEQYAGRLVFGREIAVTAPELTAWRDLLAASGVVGGPGENTPLILDSADRLYLARYFACEDWIGEDLRRRSRGIMEVGQAGAADLLAKLFPEPGRDNLQKTAAALALLKQFVLVSGGPGTGKTYTVARILAFLQALADRPLRIALAAPTGKAAVRLHESIVSAKKSLDPALAAMVPEETRTIHRLLGVFPGSGGFRHHEGNQLHLDLLVLDEASMIDVPLMADILKALPPGARLIMLGDRDQLTSVEAGSLFGDICPQSQPPWSHALSSRLQKLTAAGNVPTVAQETLGDSIVILQESYRFREKSGLGELALAVRSGRPENVAAVLQVKTRAGLHFRHPADSSFQGWLAEQLYEGFGPCFDASSPAEALAVLESFRVLCAVREGAAGVGGVNRIAEEVFRRRGKITGHDPWYRGKPLMITANHYSLQLFNGDTGIVWPDSEQRFWAWFLKPDGEMRKIALAGLPNYETAYAITVHKSQGSEFAKVLFILPLAESRVLNCELIYTGVTRARNSLTICGDPELLTAGIAHHVIRHSGLRDRLWANAENNSWEHE